MAKRASSGGKGKTQSGAGGKATPSAKIVLPIIEPVAAQMNIRLARVAYERENGALFLRLYVEKEGREVDLRICERFHRAIIPLMDAVEYDYLEVCTLGADRPLTRPQDFLASIGKQVDVRLFSKIDGQKAFVGDLAGYDETGISISTPEGLRAIPHSAIAVVKQIVDGPEDTEGTDR